MVQFLFDRIENVVGKGKECWEPAFSPFPTTFSKGIFPQCRQKSPLCGAVLNLNIQIADDYTKHISAGQMAYLGASLTEISARVALSDLDLYCL